MCPQPLATRKEALMAGRAVQVWAAWLAVVLCLAAPAPSVSAQGTTSAIQGVITDEGGALPGAVIVAKDTQSGFTYEADE